MFSVATVDLCIAMEAMQVCMVEFKQIMYWRQHNTYLHRELHSLYGIEYLPYSMYYENCQHGLVAMEDNGYANISLIWSAVGFLLFIANIEQSLLSHATDAAIMDDIPCLIKLK